MKALAPKKVVRKKAKREVWDSPIPPPGFDLRGVGVVVRSNWIVRPSVFVTERVCRWAPVDRKFVGRSVTAKMFRDFSWAAPVKTRHKVDPLPIRTSPKPGCRLVDDHEVLPATYFWTSANQKGVWSPGRNPGVTVDFSKEPEGTDYCVPVQGGRK